MRKSIQRILSYKKTIALIVIAIIGIGSYIINGIQKNVKKMADIPTVSYYPDYPTPNTEGKEATVIERGAYLVKAGDCIACHTNTPQKGPAFSGGLPMQTPFGTIYSPNITPDKETGIGNWTDEQFINAMREGISPEGHRYYPAFPYLYFNKVTTEDLIAIKAYLDNIPAIHQPNIKPDMIWPFNWRFLQSGWRLLFFSPNKTGPYQSDSRQSTDWNRGAYLVEGLGHCAMCHTPSYYLLDKSLPLGAPIQKYNLTGAPIQGFLAPNITSSNLEKVSDEEILAVFTQNRLIGGGSVEGPMLEANHNSLRHLSRADLLSIITYLKSVKSTMPPKPKSGRGGVGKGIYDSYCTGCHANGGGGAPIYGDATAWESILKNGMPVIYTNAIKGIGGMPAKGTCLSCSDDEIKQAVDYMIASVTGKSVVHAEKPKRLTMDDGKRIYEQNCSVCHTSGFKNAPKPGDIEAWKPMVDAGFLATYENIMAGRKGHLPHGACVDCSDAEIVAAVKYMMQESAPGKDYSLW